MGWTDLTLTVRTPMFLGLDGVRMEQLDAETEVAFPVPSLRGALRHWLRALAGTEVGNDLPRLAAVETAVFGAAADRNRPADQGGPGPSRVAIQALPPALRYTPAGTTPSWLRRAGGGRGTGQPNPTGYLLGQGMYDAVQDRLRRPFVAPDFHVRLRVRVRGRKQDPIDVEKAVTDLFWCALWALRTFGGLGARARRGFGTLSVSLAPGTDVGGAAFDRRWLDRNDHDYLDAVIACARDAVRTLDATANGTGRHADTGIDTAATPTYPAFLPGAYTMMDEPLGTSPTAGLADALAATGAKLREFRTDAQGDPNASTREWETILRPWLDDDRSGLVEPFEIGALGLPVVFAQKLRAEGGRTATRTVTVTPEGIKIDRRASPLWLRVYPDDSGHWRLRSLAMCCEWLPPDAHLVARTRGRRPEQLTKPTQDQVSTFLRYWFE